MIFLMMGEKLGNVSFGACSDELIFCLTITLFGVFLLSKEEIIFHVAIYTKKPEHKNTHIPIVVIIIVVYIEFCPP